VFLLKAPSYGTVTTGFYMLKAFQNLFFFSEKKGIFEKEVGNEETCGAGGDNYLATRKIRYSEFALGAVC
jgi:hypothetical protein